MTIDRVIIHTYMTFIRWKKSGRISNSETPFLITVSMSISRSLLIAAIFPFAFAVFQLPLHRIESEYERNRRLGIEPRRKLISPEVSSSLTPTDFGDLAYVGIVYIGSQRTPFSVLLDTGSSDFWVPDISCGYCDYFCHGLSDYYCPKYCDPKCCVFQSDITFPYGSNDCLKQDLFNGGNSSSYRTHKGVWKARYGGGEAHGFYGNDFMELAGMEINVTFGQATYLSTDFVLNYRLDGILGLGFQSLSVGGITPPVIAAAQQGIIPAAYFTVYFKAAGLAKTTNDGGLFTFGGNDTVNCDSNINFVSLTSATYFQFRLEKFSFNGTTYNDGYEVISDTGSSFLHMPAAIYDALIDSFPVTARGGYEYVNCSDEYPDLEFTIGGVEYRVTSNNYLIPESETSKNAGECRLAFGSIPDGYHFQWVLGDVFIREYCNIYDIDNKRIGFAKAL